jgi:signal peptidase I
MEPTLVSGDRLLVLRRARLRIGDIVALHDPRDDPRDAPRDEPPDALRRLMVKRVVSMDGDTVAVEGDNSGSSTDSRVFGPVDRRALVGRAVYRYFPPGRAGRLL